jgi:hypothetical protein
MSPTDPDKLIDAPDVVGYAGVVLAAPMAIFQGMFIPQSGFDRADAVIATLAKGMRAVGMDPDDPNVMANALASGVADALQFSRDSDTGAFLAGISKLKGARYFIIRARPSDRAEDGLITSIEVMLARSPRDARSVFEQQADVIALKMATVMSAVRTPGATRN